MSKVYVVFLYYHYEGVEVLKIFASEANAIKFIDNYIADHQELGYNWYKMDDYQSIKYKFTDHCRDIYYEEVDVVEELEGEIE